jgi:hypothetical protein
MPVNLVSAPSSTTVQAAPQRKPQESQAEKPEATQRPTTDEAAKSRQAQQQQAQKTEPAKPVLNAQGQKTGQVISVTA